jgi:hypothetical protein
MTRPQSRHVREKMSKESSLLCGGGRALEPLELKSVALAKWKYEKGDCARCVRIVKKRMG